MHAAHTCSYTGVCMCDTCVLYMYINVHCTMSCMWIGVYVCVCTCVLEKCRVDLWCSYTCINTWTCTCTTCLYVHVCLYWSPVATDRVQECLTTMEGGLGASQEGQETGSTRLDPTHLNLLYCHSVSCPQLAQDDESGMNTHTHACTNTHTDTHMHTYKLLES